MCARHSRIVLIIVKQSEGLVDDSAPVRSDETGRPGLNTFRTLCGLPHDKDRLTQRWRFLLNAARIGQNKISKGEKCDKVGILLRGDQFDVRVIR